MLEDKLRSLFLEKHITFKEYKNSFVLDCPKCGKEQHTWVRKSDGRTICFKCNSKWAVVRFVKVLFKISYEESQSLLFDIILSDSPLKIEFKLNVKRFDLFEEEKEDVLPEFKPFFIPQTFFLPANKSERAMEYLRKRQVTDLSVIAKFDIRYNAIMDAIVFPIKRTGITYGYTARFINPAPNRPRMQISAGFKKAYFLANYDNALQEENIILTEGMFDCVQADIPGFGGVASFGKLVSNDQIDLLNAAPAKNIYIGLDPDAANESKEVYEKLDRTKRVYRLLPPANKKDLGECTKEEISECIKNASLINSMRLEIFLKFK